jgi:hypothetical protein
LADECVARADSLDQGDDRRHQVVDVDRLQLLRSLAGQRDQRQAGEPREQAGAAAARPIDQRRLHHHRRERQLQQEVVSRLLARMVAAAGAGIGTER